ncbi:MAG: hypothetical protein DRO87_13280, partial [Candidatus Thorarchaeota archaeon]
TTVKDECSEWANDTTVDWYDENWNHVATGYNTSWFIPSNFPIGPRTINTNATRSHFDEGTNSTDVYVYGWSRISNIQPSSGSSYMAGISVAVKCTVKDANTGSPLPSYPVKFYKNGTYQYTGSTEISGIATWSWETTDELPGWYNISCTIENSTSMYYNATTYLAYSLIKIQRPLKIENINLNPGTVYRNNSFSPYETNVTVTILEAEIGAAENATAWFFNESFGLIGNCTTDVVGQCHITYDPGDTWVPDYYIHQRHQEWN